MTETTVQAIGATPGQQHLDQMIELVTELTSENWKQSREIIRLRKVNAELRAACGTAADVMAEATWGPPVDKRGLNHAIDKCRAALMEAQPANGGTA